MSPPKFDPVIHAPLRLQICALLSPMWTADFQMLRDELGISDSVLSKHIKQLEDAGYVMQTKAAKNGRQRTTVIFTGKGRKAFQRHIATLQALASLANGNDKAEDDPET
ncbi:MAG TPA: transcriptional regulator [Hyphomonadaceae bacterium]|nr:transcriptional regulator [Hyphomonadaceae bacterium]